MNEYRKPNFNFAENKPYVLAARQNPDGTYTVTAKANTVVRTKPKKVSFIKQIFRRIAWHLF